MLSGRITRTLIRVLDRIPSKSESNANIPAHLLIGQRGEKDAYFYLRRKGHVMFRAQLSDGAAPRRD